MLIPPPLLFFLVVIIIFRKELGVIGILTAVTISIAAFVASELLRQIAWYNVVQTLVDIVLVVILFRDVRSL